MQFPQLDFQSLHFHYVPVLCKHLLTLTLIFTDTLVCTFHSFLFLYPGLEATELQLSCFIKLKRGQWFCRNDQIRIRGFQFYRTNSRLLTPIGCEMKRISLFFSVSQNFTCDLHNRFSLVMYRRMKACLNSDLLSERNFYFSLVTQSSRVSKVIHGNTK